MQHICHSPDETFALGESIGAGLDSGDVVLLYGNLGAGKTLLTKGIMSGLGYDVDEVTSPSFALVNLYKADRFDVYHIDLWRLDHSQDPAMDVGLDEILADGRAVTIIEWADRLSAPPTALKVIRIEIKGDGDAPREISIKAAGQDDQ
jgi:tRNA threonylcarbamoyladenosine biosynthesis protein TsaE